MPAGNQQPCLRILGSAATLSASAAASTTAKPDHHVAAATTTASAARDTPAALTVAATTPSGALASCSFRSVITAAAGPATSSAVSARPIPGQRAAAATHSL